MNISDLHEGMYVKVKNRRMPGWNPDGYMDRYCGRVVRISKVNRDNSVHIDQDPDDHRELKGRKWNFKPNDFDAIVNENCIFVN